MENDEIIERHQYHADDGDAGFYESCVNEMLDEVKVNTTKQILEELEKIKIYSNDSRDYFLREGINRRYILFDEDEYNLWKIKLEAVTR